MYYIDGTKVCVGDKVSFDPNITGKIVCSIDDKQFNEKYPENDWEYLKVGVLVETNEIGLVHLEENDINLIRIM